MATQGERLLAHLQGGETITSLEAFNVLGITQLSSRIGELEKQGYDITHTPIKVENRFGESVRVVQYSMVTRRAIQGGATIASRAVNVK